MKDRFADGFTTYPMPTGSYYSEQAKLHRALVRDERYQKAKSCKLCTDTADSFNRYVSTYCHLKQENIAGMGKDLLDRCMTCELYQPATEKGRLN